jgi:hypothetical protein
MDHDIPRPAFLDNHRGTPFQIDAVQLINLFTECLQKLTVQHQVRPSSSRPSTRTAAPTTARRRQRPADVPVGDGFRSTNPDFRQLVRHTVAIAKLLHTEANWERFPPSLDRSLARFAGSIHPPVPVESFKEDLASLTEKYRNDIRDLVISSNSGAIGQILDLVHYLDQSDLDEAHRIAVRQLKRTFGSRMSDDTIQTALQLSRCPYTDDVWRTASRRSSTSSTRSSESAPIPTANRFQTLATEDNDDGLGRPIEMETTPSVSPRTRTARRRRSSSGSTTAPKRVVHHPSESTEQRAPTPPKATPVTVDEAVPVDVGASSSLPPSTPASAVVTVPTPSSSADRETSSTAAAAAASSSTPTNDNYVIRLPSVFRREAFERWTIKPEMVHPDSSVVVLADSNGAAWKRIPSNWTVLVRPAATLEELCRSLDDASLPDTVSKVIIAVGINNHRSAAVSSTEALRALSSSLKKLHASAYFLQVPTHPRMDSASGRNILQINKTARVQFGAKYVSLPTDFAFKPRNDNRFDVVHYDSTTATSIITHLSEAVHP